MNDGTRKAANALVAVVDFFSGALAQEAQAREVQERQLQQLAEQLKNHAELEAEVEALRHKSGVFEKLNESQRVTIESLTSEMQDLKANLNKAYGEIGDARGGFSPEAARKLLLLIEVVDDIAEWADRRTLQPERGDDLLRQLLRARSAVHEFRDELKP